MRVRIFQPQCFGTVSVAVAHGQYRSRFHSTRRKVRHHVTWCLAKTIYQTSRWDVAVTNGHCSRAVLPLTPPEITETCSVRTSSSLSQTFCAPNSPDLNTVLAFWSALQQIFYHYQNFYWQNEESDCQKHGNYRMAHLLPIHHFYHLFTYLRLMLFARWRRCFPRLIRINYGMMFRNQNESRPWFVPKLVKICSIFLKL